MSVSEATTHHVAVSEPIRGRIRRMFGEIAKLPAFLRRDVLVALSYRLSFVSDIVSLVLMVTVFHFVSKMIDPTVLPEYGGRNPTYMEFVVVGIALGAFIALGLNRMTSAIRNEQLMGTLESLLMTPTMSATVLIGSVAYDIVYIPLRTLLFLVVATVVFDLQYELEGVGQAAAILFLFIPFIWGLGVISAALILTFKRGSGFVGIGAVLLTLASGAYFPIALLPGWLVPIAEANPIAVAIGGMREAIIGGAGWGEVAADLAYLLPMSVLSLIVGILAFRLGLRRERRTGTLGLY